MAHSDAPRAGRTTWRRLSLVLAPALLIGTLSTGAPAASAVPRAATGDEQPAASQDLTNGRQPSGEPRAWPSLPSRPDVESSSAHDRKGAQTPNLAPSLHDDAGRPAQATARPAERGDAVGTIRVTVEATDASAGRRAVASVDGTNVIVGGDLVEADVRPDQLTELAGADGVRFVREPRRPVEHEESEGLATTGSGAWQAGGYAGAGATVAVIDAGFTDYVSRLGTELPATPEIDLGRCGDPFATEHGTAVAEIVHDMAPDATLRLVCINTDVEIINALDTLPAAVDVVNISLGWTLLDRGDGSGPISAAIERARDRGVLVVVAAGNYGGEADIGIHRHQAASGDTPGPSLVNRVNLPGSDDALGFLVAAGQTGYVSLQWDSWPNTAQDFDLYIGDDQGDIVDFSERVQNGSGGNDAPIEAASVTNTSGGDRVYFVLVNRWAGTAAPRMDIFFDGGVFASESPTPSSISDPAVSRAALSVGAHCYASGDIAVYSSRGPTIDGRVKPDLTGPDGTSSSIYGAADGCSSSGFFGTSAAAPHVAGAAAQILEANPDLDVAELEQLLVDRAGLPAPTNHQGAGPLTLGPVGNGYHRVPQSFTPMPPTRLYDTRPGTQYPGELPNRTTSVSGTQTIAVVVRGFGTGVPDDAVAVSLNVTAVTPTGPGWLTVFPEGSVPTTSNVNFAKGQTVAAQVTATIGEVDPAVFIRFGGSTSDRVHIVVDVAGWYGPTGSGGPSTNRFTALGSPARAMDTRSGTPLGYAESGAGRTTPVAGNQDLDVQVAGQGGVPAEATAVILNLTGISPTAGTYLTAFPGGDPLPTASNLNAKAGQTIANLVVVPVGDGGVVSFFNAAGNTHMAIDVLGYFLPNVGAGYVALEPPTRHLDTRTGTGLRRAPIGANGTFNLKVARYDGVPADAEAVMLSVVAVTPSSSGYITVFPSGSSLPNASNINFSAGATTANAVLSRLGATGRVAFYNALGNTHVISDLAGYFIDPADVQLPPP